ncbi:MAG: MBL fold metallo-hydrolase [Pseudomonadota bacterium]|nr:MBL fold metallo-hydrolase [Pseudomonadota bacterium]MEE3070259.1 MBL fold metallo-hydrolase [Pseudomonadota bacterium]
MPFKALVTCLLTLTASVAYGQDRRPSHCIAIADAAPGLEYVQLASFSEPLADEYTVRIRYIDHAMFLLKTYGGLTAITDYAGYLGQAGLVPDVATMNNAHSTHWTPYPDPDITYVLKGWGDGQGAFADHHLDLGEMLIRNIPTDIRSSFSGAVPFGNSIFIFEVGGLCIGHMGHLHHEPSDEQYAALGRLDVTMVAVDGGATLDHDTVVKMLKRLRSSIVIPMHWFGRSTLEGFLVRMAEDFDIRRDGEVQIDVSLRNLPSRPTVVVLEPRALSAQDLGTK